MLLLGFPTVRPHFRRRERSGQRGPGDIQEPLFRSTARCCLQTPAGVCTKAAHRHCRFFCSRHPSFSAGHRAGQSEPGQPHSPGASLSPRLAPPLPPPRPHERTIHPILPACPCTGNGPCPARPGHPGAASSRSPRVTPHGQRQPNAAAPRAEAPRTPAAAPAAAPARQGSDGRCGAARGSDGRRIPPRRSPRSATCAPGTEVSLPSARPGPVPPHPRAPGEGRARREGGEAGMLGRVRNRVSPARKHPQRQPRGAPGRRPAAANVDLSACHMKTIIASAGGGEEKLKAVRRRSGGRWRPPPSRRPQRHMHPSG